MIGKSSWLLTHRKQYIDLHFLRHFLCRKGICEKASTIMHNAVIHTWEDKGPHNELHNEPFSQVCDWERSYKKDSEDKIHFFFLTTLLTLLWWSLILVLIYRKKEHNYHIAHILSVIFTAYLIHLHLRGSRV